MRQLIQLFFVFLLFSAKIYSQCETSDYGTLVISEIYFDSRYCEDISRRYHTFGEYIELYNSSNEAIDLEGWVISDNHTSFKLQADGLMNNHSNLIIEPGGFKIITYNGFYAYTNYAPSFIGGRSKFLELFPIPESISSNPENDIILQNTMVLYNNLDKVRLTTPQGKIVDEVSYNNDNQRIFTNADPLDFLQLQEYTINISPRIDNGDGGIFNGAIGNILFYHPVQLQDGTIIYVPDDEPTETIFGKASIFRSDVSSYYTGNPIVYSRGLATPMELSNGMVVPTRPLDPYFYYLHSSSNSNYTEAYSYDVKSGIENGRSKTYFDDLGRPVTSLSKDYKNDLVWGKEVVYDNFGRKWKESFPAISCFNFDKVNFLSNSILKTNFLDKYYSNNNALEAYQATAEQPYTEINYDKLNPGNVINVVGGNQINGSWKTGYGFTVPAAQEMHYIYGYDYFDGPTSTNFPDKEEIITKFYKSVSVDANGVENVVFTDGEGKALASARSGGSHKYPVVSLIGTQGYIDVHIPAGITSSDISLLGSASNYSIYDLKTGGIISTPLSGGNAYRIVANTIPTNNPRTYVNTSSGAITTDNYVLGISYKVNYYDYAINVYDKTGRNIKTIQPNAFAAAFPSAITMQAVPAYMQPNASDFITKVEHNTFGQVIVISSPDEGTSRYAYRKDGQIRYSQSELQLSLNQVSYTNYDTYGRPIEGGILTGDATIWDEANNNVDSNILILNTTSSERTFTIYDYVGNDGNLSIFIPNILSLQNQLPGYQQHNLAGNVAITYKESLTNVGTLDAISWYSYDIYGRLEWVAQYNVDLGTKTIHYEYNDKGNVSKVYYQKYTPNELFVHKYTYDINNTLEKVETSINDISFSTDAEYTYYISGELKRLNIAEGAQGLDYVYTLGGMLKSINHPSLEQAKDPGNDPNDVFGITLDYYSGDYNRINTNIITSPSITPDYNGNIKATRWATKESSHMDLDQNGNINQKGYLYNYDRNNWLTDATFGNANTSGSITPLANKYQEKGLEYDANGNITKLQRTNETGTTIDNLTYNYATTGKNQLTQVTDAVPASPQFNNDIDSGQQAGNYVYNAIGQLTLNKQEQTHYFYNTSGLVTEIKGGNLDPSIAYPIVKFYYNERGQRIRKESYSTIQPNTLQSTTYYLLDLSGNIMSVYNKPVIDIIRQIEMPIYGATRLGVCYKTVFNSETRSYQITDHLGNVRAVVQKDSSNPNLVALLSYADYYPFGEQLPERNSLDGSYRYAYQGQEKDGETGMEAFQLRLWDGRLGRWLTPDPYGQYHSPYLGMDNNPISSIDSDGGWSSKFWRDVAWAFRGFQGDRFENPEAINTNYRYGIKDSYVIKNGNGSVLDEIVLNSIYSTKTDSKHLWNSEFIRNKTGDGFSIGGGYAFNVFLGGDIDLEFNWIIRGKDRSFVPYLTIGPSVSIGDGAEVTASIYGSIKQYNGTVSEISAMDFLGYSGYVEAGLTPGIGGQVGVDVAVNPNGKVTWVSVYGGLSGGAEASPFTAVNVKGGVRHSTIMVHFREDAIYVNNPTSPSKNYSYKF
ncbi:MAG TPA: lamin tail domain-containing protein [Flavobacterium sp.]|uniref:RHS repeat-associated core domain-containing protein n=2 Tax=Flavobacterium TaxID=237 RepID=UPI0025C71025|nr:MULTISPECIES: lamin tail domain-containing protein [unclassified Flavobacterium]HRE76424.1 lamin tail domain-containing protein [Flavobacterium sp.]